MPLKYSVITVWTSEEAAHKGNRLVKALPRFVKGLKIAARCMVTKGVCGCFENGEIATGGIEVLSHNMPVKIEIVLPSSEAAMVLRSLGEMVDDGVILVNEAAASTHKVRKRLIPRHLLTRDVMTPSPTTVRKSTPLAEAVSLLLESDFNAIPVVNNKGVPVGIITQGDLIKRGGMPVRLGILDDLKSGQLDAVLSSMKERNAGEVMTNPVVSVKQDSPLEEAVRIMLKRKLKRLPVVDKSGNLCGILARFDVLRTIIQDTPNWDSIAKKGVRVDGDTKVGDAMRVDAPVAGPGTPCRDLLAMISSSDIQRIAVVDGSGKFLGMIFDRALAAALTKTPSLITRLLSRPFSLKNLISDKQAASGIANKTARQLMKTKIVTIGEDARIEEAIKLMANEGIKRLPVVDASGSYKGMISRDSLLRAALKY